jgi:hypothetical protein
VRLDLVLLVQEADSSLDPGRRLKDLVDGGFDRVDANGAGQACREVDGEQRNAGGVAGGEQRADVLRGAHVADLVLVDVRHPRDACAQDGKPGSGETGGGAALVLVSLVARGGECT